MESEVVVGYKYVIIKIRRGRGSHPYLSVFCLASHAQQGVSWDSFLMFVAEILKFHLSTHRPDLIDFLLLGLLSAKK